MNVFLKARSGFIHVAGFFALVILSALALPTHAVTAAKTAQKVLTPNEVVKDLSSQLADKLEGKRQYLKHHKQELVTLIDDTFLPHFAVNYAAILVLGQHARQATPKQRADFASAFYKSITRRYGEALLDYTRGSVSVLPQRGKLNDRRTIVRTRVKLSSGKRVSVNYAFRKSHDGKWKVYDVIIEGISYISNYRNQVDAQIRANGLDALIKKLQSEGGKALDDISKNNHG